MGEILVGQVLERSPDAALELPPLEQDPIARLTAGWTWSFDSPHTRAAYRRDLEQWLEFCRDRDQDPLTVTRGHGNLYARWVEAGPPALSAASLARKLAAISSWYNYLADEDAVPANPFARVRRPKVERFRSKTAGLEESEARAMVVAADRDHGRAALRTSALIRFMLTIGPRVSEVSSLNVGSLGFERGHRTVLIVGKGRKERLRNLPPAPGTAIDRYLEYRMARSSVAVLEPSVPLFAVADGGRVSTGYLFELVRRIAREAGLEYPDRVTPHVLRHTFATMSEESGATVKQIQERLGHTSSATTDIYIHAKNRLETDPSQLVAAKIG
jgi:site-specific recombinase XerD